MDLNMPQLFILTKILVIFLHKVVAGSQDKSLKFFTTDGSLYKEVPNAHNDIIRDIKEADGVIYTCSNDELIKIWTIDGEQLGEVSGHQGYVYNIACKE